MNAQPLPLRDIHLPDGVSWWPPAPGWWLLLALLLGAAIALWYWRRRGSVRWSLYRQALQELERIENGFGQKDNERLVLENLSVLLRRVAVSRHPRTQVASLTGPRWLEFLDSVSGGTGFSGGPGRILADAPYNPALRTDNIPDLIDLCRRWLEAEFKRKPAAAPVKSKTA
ncbi:MAG TPA: DUF4381 domain-containing protein [Gammaproteobacteria bacterium]|nr:DUF4381 domain-containing protein [Gammaproteobacteria bacterium]